MATLESLKAEHPILELWLRPTEERALCSTELAIAALTAAKLEDEATIKEKDARIAELETKLLKADALATRLINEHGPRGLSPYSMALISEGDLEILRAQLSAEQAAHAATKEELRKVDEALIQALPWDPRARAHPYECAWVRSRQFESNSGPLPCDCWLSVAEAALARQAHRAADAAKEE